MGFMEGKLERNTRREQFEPNDNAIGKLEFWSVIYDETEKEGFIYSEILDSVYMRSSQNSQPNSDTPDMNSRKER